MRKPVQRGCIVCSDSHSHLAEELTYHRDTLPQSAGRHLARALSAPAHCLSSVHEVRPLGTKLDSRTGDWGAVADVGAGASREQSICCQDSPGRAVS